MKEDLMISFSGGRTSALMTINLLQQRPDAAVIFANTGLEDPKTIKFIRRCNTEFKFNLICLEAFVQFGERVSTSYKVVDIDNLNMSGEPFENVIKKYGIPNNGFPHCTRELKINPIHNWAKDNLTEKYQTAIGIRADEIDRIPSDYKTKRYIYPLANAKITKEMVLEFWRLQPFDLDLPERLGNCVTCWKKSDKKLFQILKERPSAFDFFDRMERVYKDFGKGSGNRKFFRGHRSVADLKNQMIAQSEFDFDDTPNGCEESCEVF